MSFTFHKINNSPEFLHSDSVPVVKNYNLYLAIKELKEFVTGPSPDLNSIEYSSLKDNLEEAMINEIDPIDTYSMILETYINCSALISAEPDEPRYQGLYNLFNFLVKTKGVLEYASRVKQFKSVMKFEDKLVINNLKEEKGLQYSFVDSDYGFEFSLNTLQILNLQAIDNIDSSLLPEYVLALSDSVPLEKMLKNNLFNYNTFSNSELLFYTLMPNVDDLYIKAESTKTFMYASSYFWVETDNRYETFNNYIDFNYLESVFSYMIENLKYYLDALDSSSITQNKDPLSFYPSGQTELFYVIKVMRKILAILSIIYNLAKMFKDQYFTKKELDNYQTALENLLDAQVTDTNILAKFQVQYPDMTQDELDGILYDKAGTEEQNNYLNSIFTGSEEAYEYSMVIMESISDYVSIMQETSRGYNSVVSDGTESGLFLDDISQKLMDFMENILGKVSLLRNILNFIKGNTLPSFSFLYTINWVLDLSFLNKLSQLITSFNKFMYNFNCLLNAIACFASYIKDMFDTLKSFFESEDKFDLTKYMVGSFSTSFNNSATTVTTDMLADNQSSILSILSESLSKSDLARVADALSYSIKNVNSSCIGTWVDNLYNEALTSMKESIKAGQRCKITPGGRLKIDAGLRFNLGVDIPDLRFQFRNCTGAS